MLFGLQCDAVAVGAYDMKVSTVNIFKLFCSKHVACSPPFVFKELSNHGFNQTRIQRENLLPRQTITNIRAGKSITLETLNKICVMCNLQPGDIIEVVLTDEERMKYNI